MADNLKTPAGAAPPAPAGSKVQPKKETVRISLPPKPAAKETVRLQLPPKAAASAAPAGVTPPKPAAPAPPKPATPPPAAPAPAGPPGGAAGAAQTVRLSLPPKPSAAKETVRLSLPPKPAAGGPPGGAKPAPAGGKEIKLLVPQVDEAAASAQIPESAEAEIPTMDSSQAPAAAAKPAGLKGGPPGSKPAASAGPAPGKMAAASTPIQPDSTASAMALPAKKAAPKVEMAAPVQMAAGGVVVRKAGWPDYVLAILALLVGVAAALHLLMIVGS